MLRKVVSSEFFLHFFIKDHFDEFFHATVAQFVSTNIMMFENENGGSAIFYATDHFLVLITSLNNFNQEMHLGNNTG